MKVAGAGAVILACALGASAQTSAPTGSSTTPPPVLVQKDVQQQLSALISTARPSGLASTTLADYGSYQIQLSVRTASGGAEVHAHWDDVMVVEKGKATLVTGGTVVGGKSGQNGEIRGTRIEAGQSKAISAGDVLTVRAGTPHQLLLAPGVVFGAVIVKVHEP